MKAQYPAAGHARQLKVGGLGDLRKVGRVSPRPQDHRQPSPRWAQCFCLSRQFSA
jgi:hypothetical protein